MADELEQPSAPPDPSPPAEQAPTGSDEVPYPAPQMEEVGKSNDPPGERRG